MSYVRASTEGYSHGEEEGQEVLQVLTAPSMVAVDTHRRLPRPLDVPIPGAPNAIG